MKRGNISTSPAAARTRAAHPRIWPAVFFAALSLAGCGAKAPGSFDVDESNQSKWEDIANLVQFKKAKPALDPSNPVKCPDIVIQDGTADDRVYGSATDQSNANLRYQFSITDIARDCQVVGDKMSLKAGIAGKILLGPVGAPGNFTGPVRVAVINNNDQSVVVSKLYQVGVGIPAGQSEGAFSLVTEPFDVPYPHSKAQLDYTIRVGFDTGAGGKKLRKGRLPEASEGMPTAPAAASDDSTPHRHHHRRAAASAPD